ncbi:hypothetical protein BDV18DRAFT_120158 [Aspergillus unguis]
MTLLLRQKHTLLQRQLHLLSRTYLQQKPPFRRELYSRSQLRNTSASKRTMPPKASKPQPTTTTSPPKSNLKPPPTDLPIHTFATPDLFSTFLSANHTTSPGIYLKLAKKASGIPSITAPQAVEVALCFGWIDGRANALDEKYWLVRYTPRRAKSIWSKKNVDTVERLVKEGKMREAGMEAVNAAKKDGRWERAYDGPAKMEVPPDLESALDESANEDAKRVFVGLNKTERYAILHRLQTGAVGKRTERIEKTVEMLNSKAKASRVVKTVKKQKIENAGKMSSTDGKAPASQTSRTRSGTRAKP